MNRYREKVRASQAAIERRESKALMAYTDKLIGLSTERPIDLTEKERVRLAPLFQLSDRLHQSMPPVRPSSAFVQSLGKELVEKARRRSMMAKRLRRGALIGAAALGSLLSIASIVGAIVFIIARLRQRAQTRAVQAPTA